MNLKAKCFWCSPFRTSSSPLVALELPPSDVFAFFLSRFFLFFSELTLLPTASGAAGDGAAFATGDSSSESESDSYETTTTRTMRITNI